MSISSANHAFQLPSSVNDPTQSTIHYFQISGTGFTGVTAACIQDGSMVNGYHVTWSTPTNLVVTDTSIVFSSTARLTTVAQATCPIGPTSASDPGTRLTDGYITITIFQGDPYPYANVQAWYYILP